MTVEASPLSPTPQTGAMLELPRRYLIAKEANDFLLLHRKPVQPPGELLREKFPMRHVSFG